MAEPGFVSDPLVQRWQASVPATNHDSHPIIRYVTKDQNIPELTKDGRIMKALYPKPDPQPEVGRVYWEWRFYCRTCWKERIYNTAFKKASELPKSPQFVYNPDTRRLEPNPVLA